ncbi:MAG: domain 2, partial [Planctomycetota bacterium]
MSSFYYIDPRGRRSGPYSEDELKLLVNKGLLESDGLIELDGLATTWSIAEIP